MKSFASNISELRVKVVNRSPMEPESLLEDQLLQNIVSIDEEVPILENPEFELFLYSKTIWTKNLSH